MPAPHRGALVTAPGARFPAVALFDLDGTLLDSAPDMLATVNRLRAARGMTAMPFAPLRAQVSHGGRAMLGAAFPEMPLDARIALVPEFLDTYQSLLGQYSALFEGVAGMLQALEDAGSRWGIISNKPEYLARIAVEQLGWASRCAVLIGGDTLAERKPHPLPLQVAAARLEVTANDCIYVGDDARDIEAARAAGMASVAALWGYRSDDDDPATWGADVVLVSAVQLQQPAAWPRRR